MTKSQDLIRRKDLLRSQLLTIERDIAEETGQLDDHNLLKFIKDGVLISQDGYKLQKLQKSKMALLAVEKGLNRKIMMARESERKKAIRTKEAEVAKVEKERHRLGAKRLSLLKQAQAIAQQLKDLGETLMVKQQGINKRPEVTVFFKLPDVEKFLAENYVQDPQKVRDEVKKAIEYNKAMFAPGVHPVGHRRSDVIALFKVTLMKDSGVIVKMEEQGPSLEAASRRKDVKRAFLGGDEK